MLHQFLSLFLIFFVAPHLESWKYSPILNLLDYPLDFNMVTSGFTTQADTPKALSIFILIFYILLLQPVTFIFYKHGLRSWLAWTPLQTLCLLRIVGSGVQLDDHKTKTLTVAALVLNNIGLAPLLLAAIGILHEA